MGESSLVWLQVAKWATVLIFAFWYVLGGRSSRWRRRFVGGAFIGFALNLLAIPYGWNPWLLLMIPAYIGTLHLGYGGKSVMEKLQRRGLYGAAFGLCAFLLSWITGSWFLGGFQTLLALSSSTFLGVTNPARSAVDEESLIAGLSVCITPFMV